MDGRNVFIGHFAEENHCSKLSTDESIVEDVIISAMEPHFTLGGTWSDEAVAYILYKPQNGNQAVSGLEMIKREMVEGGLNENNIHIQSYAAVGGAMADTSGPKGKILVDWTKNQGGGNHLAYYMQNDKPVFERDFDKQGNPCEEDADCWGKMWIVDS